MNINKYSLIIATPVLLLGAIHGQAMVFTNLYEFSAADFNASSQETNFDGLGPDSVVLVGNAIYGTAQSGGIYGYGTLFRVNTDGSGFTNLFNFNRGGYDAVTGTYTNSTGWQPNPGLLLISNTLYGTTFDGGASDAGTIYKINLDGSGFTQLFSFSFTNGQGPSSGLTLYNNTLYGTTAGGGTNLNGAGTVYSIGLNGGLQTIYEFTNEADPYGGVVVTTNGIYGFAYFEGASTNGFVYHLGSGPLDLFDFNGVTGKQPYSTPLLVGNALFGVTTAGGTNGSGNIFRIDTDGQNFTNLYSFSPASGANMDGSRPIDLGGLILSGNTLYGTATLNGSGGQGTVFKIGTDGTGFMVLHSFSDSDGGQPYALALSGGTLYGMALVGINGPSLGDGSVFEIVLQPTLKLQLSGNNAVLTWNDPSYSLHNASSLLTTFTAVNGATSPYTNHINGTQMFYELK